MTQTHNQLHATAEASTNSSLIGFSAFTVLSNCPRDSANGVNGSAIPEAAGSCVSQNEANF